MTNSLREILTMHWNSQDWVKTVALVGLQILVASTGAEVTNRGWSDEVLLKP